MTFNPTPKQRAHLAQLAGYLESLPEDYAHFNIETYYGDARRRSLSMAEVARPGRFHCGSAACAIGHGPVAGIRRNKTDRGAWFLYAGRVFGTDESATLEGRHMFGIQNGGNHHDAARRIREVLANLGDQP